MWVTLIGSQSDHSPKAYPCPWPVRNTLKLYENTRLVTSFHEVLQFSVMYKENHVSTEISQVGSPRLLPGAVLHHIQGCYSTSLGVQHLHNVYNFSSIVFTITHVGPRRTLLVRSCPFMGEDTAHKTSVSKTMTAAPWWRRTQSMKSIPTHTILRWESSGLPISCGNSRQNTSERNSIETWPEAYGGNTYA